MLADEALCTGTTHPTCQACARRHWPVSIDRGHCWNEWCNNIAPPINLSTGRCPEFATRGTPRSAE